jgi:glycerophosphoryl diester phosphodiesterase
MLWIAHRGESHDWPENTLLAFQKAWEAGDPACECDVHLTADGKVIVCHDETTGRTCGRDLIIKNSTVEELRALDAGMGQRLPLLSDCLAAMPADRTFFIEIKSGIDVVPALTAVIAQSGLSAQQIVFITFHVDALIAVKKIMPKYSAMLLASFEAGKPTIDEWIARAISIGADGLDVEFPGPLDAASAARVKVAGLQLTVWTVDAPEQARELIQMGVDGITTNRCAWLRQNTSSV